MIDFNPLFEFSRTYCAGICAVLVPLNLLLTSQTVLLAILNRPKVQINTAAGVAIFSAIAMVLHVATWLVIDVVMAPTFILLALATLCLVENIWTIFAPQIWPRWLKLAQAKARSLGVKSKPEVDRFRSLQGLHN